VWEYQVETLGGKKTCEYYVLCFYCMQKALEADEDGTGQRSKYVNTCNVM